MIERILRDTDNGIRTTDAIVSSVSKLNNYASMNIIKIDVSNIDVEQAAQKIISYIGE